MIAPLVAALGLWLAPGQDAATTRPAPVAIADPTRADTLLAAFDPLIGKTWRGASITAENVVDEVRFERTAGDKAIWSTHSAAGGAYTGDTLIVFDRDTGGLVSFYATSGGFYTTGTVKVLGPGRFEFEQQVHGLDGIEAVRAQTTFEDNVYRIRSQHLINGAWVETGGFDYRPID
ncbi:hypothetical protein GCM10009422_23230 [Brevundimonas kwangchunensis]|uniref:DUF1579 domain-containing protein n=1 Tax=Brevundimonas kwangchunensis TaxID=322163 RepID=A0ABN1H0W7_9CAUL